MTVNELVDHRVDTQIRQSKWIVRRTFETLSGHKIRATVAHDPYQFQCDYFAEVFSPTELQWNRVHTEAPDEWDEHLHVLFLEKMTAEQWDSVDLLIGKMAKVAEELLS